MTGPKLVIGVGNRDRGDDGFGPMVIDALALRRPRGTSGDGPEFAVYEGDLSSLPLHWTADHRVVLVDAMVSGRPIGSVLVIDARAGTLEPTSDLLSSHGIGLADAVELARLLRRLPASLTVIAVEVAPPDSGAFDHFSAPHPETEALAREVTDALAGWAWSPTDEPLLSEAFHPRGAATQPSS